MLNSMTAYGKGGAVCDGLTVTAELKSLQATRQLGYLLVLGLNSDDSIKRLKVPAGPWSARRRRRIYLQLLIVLIMSSSLMRTLLSM